MWRQKQSHKPRMPRAPRSARGKNRSFSRGFGGTTTFPTPWFWTSSLWNYKRTNFHCLSHPVCSALWHFMQLEIGVFQCSGGVLVVYHRAPQCPHQWNLFAVLCSRRKWFLMNINLRVLYRKYLVRSEDMPTQTPCCREPSSSTGILPGKAIPQGSSLLWALPEGLA